VVGRPALRALLHQLQVLQRAAGERSGAVPDQQVSGDVRVAVGPGAQRAGALSLARRQEVLAPSAQHVPGAGEQDQRSTIE
jgi:hypothetical protein